MFGVPAAKRIKRSEIFDNDADTGGEQDNASIDEDTVPNYGFEYDFVTSNVEPSVPNIVKEETFQFNLFKAAPKAPSQAKKTESEDVADSSARTITESGPALISIRSPTPEPSGGVTEGNLNRPRPDSFYFTAATSSQSLARLHEEYYQSAISGEAVIYSSGGKRMGTQLSWRVVHLPAHPKQIVEDRTSGKNNTTSKNIADLAAASIGTVSSKNLQRRPRPSRKRRELLKRKSARRQAVIDATKTKEEHEKEKRNKKNRDRKLKRRAKERREKEEAKSFAVESEANV